MGEELKGGREKGKNDGQREDREKRKRSQGGEEGKRRGNLREGGRQVLRDCCREEGWRPWLWLQSLHHTLSGSCMHAAWVGRAAHDLLTHSQRHTHTLNMTACPCVSITDAKLKAKRQSKRRNKEGERKKSGRKWKIKKSREVRSICAVPHPSVKFERTCFKWFQAVEECFRDRNDDPKTLLSAFPYTVKWFCLRLYSVKLIKELKI